MKNFSQVADGYPFEELACDLHRWFDYPLAQPPGELQFELKIAGATYKNYKPPNISSPITGVHIHTTYSLSQSRDTVSFNFTLHFFAKQYPAF